MKSIVNHTGSSTGVPPLEKVALVEDEIADELALPKTTITTPNNDRTDLSGHIPKSRFHTQTGVHSWRTPALDSLRAHASYASEGLKPVQRGQNTTRNGPRSLRTVPEQTAR